MTINLKIKTISNKIEQSKGQYNLNKQTATISTLSSGIVKDQMNVNNRKDIIRTIEKMKLGKKILK